MPDGEQKRGRRGSRRPGSPAQGSRPGAPPLGVVAVDQRFPFVAAHPGEGATPTCRRSPPRPTRPCGRSRPTDRTISARMSGSSAPGMPRAGSGGSSPRRSRAGRVSRRRSVRLRRRFPSEPFLDVVSIYCRSTRGLARRSTGTEQASLALPWARGSARQLRLHIRRRLQKLRRKRLEARQASRQALELFRRLSSGSCGRMTASPDRMSNSTARRTSAGRLLRNASMM